MIKFDKNEFLKPQIYSTLDEYESRCNVTKEIIEEIEQLQQENEQLQQENKILKENAENNDKVVDKVNWENMLLKKKNKQLKDNWNMLKEHLKNKYDNGTESIIYRQVFMEIREAMQVLEIAQELEGSDSNE